MVESSFLDEDPVLFALLKVERGLDPICLDIYFDGEAFERDLAAEYPHHGLAKVSVPFELLDGSVAVVPVDWVGVPTSAVRLRRRGGVQRWQA